MRFTLGTEYGIRALIELAARYGDGPVPARTIATAQGIPLRFLEHQLAALHKAGIVDSQRGANGGATLARDPSAIRISEVIDALEGPLAPMYCLEPHDDRCVQTHQCGVQELWMRVEDAVRDVFERTTIADIATRHRELQPLLWPSMLTRSTPQN
ncbi:MAG TPA: Rrf2 family transcriptional regulator [Actinomycetota bacterium]|nr:Rrf2 family transcriptional regulator [Actinomycetota bacterium]